MAQTAFTMVLLAIAAAVALLLGVVGIYGVVSQVVSQRTGEIGVRMALGARPGRVEAMMVGQSALVAFGGLMFGLGGVMVAGRLIESLLYDVHPRDPAVIAGTAFIVFLASLLACWPAARRASRISPTDALRSD